MTTDMPAVEGLSAAYPATIIFIALTLAAAFVAAVRHAAPQAVGRATLAAAVWLGGTGLLAASGLLYFDGVPPTMLALVAVLTAAVVVFTRGPVGGRVAFALPLALLVGFQAFRIPIELWLHWGWDAGVFPERMTYSGANFDIMTGVSALVVAALVHLGLAGRRLVLAWNAMGLILLLTIVVIAILSAPVPFRVFTEGPPNVYVTGFPGVWLPAVAVQAALLGHLLVFRRLLGRPAPAGATAAA